MSDYRVGVQVDIDGLEKLDNLESKLNSIKKNTVEIDVKLNDKDLKNISSLLNGVSKSGNNNSVVLGVDAKDAKKTISGVIDDVNRVSSAIRNGVLIRVKTDGIDNIGNAVTVIDTLNKKGEVTSRTINTVSDSLDKASSKAKLFKDAVNAKSKFDSGEFDLGFKKAESEMSKLSSTSKELESSMKQLKTAKKNLNNVFKDKDIDADNIRDMKNMISAQDDYLDLLRQVQNQLRINAIEQKDTVGKVNFDNQKEILDMKLQRWLKDNSAATRQFGSEIDNLRTKLKSVTDVQGLKNIESDFKKVDLEAAIVGKKGLNFADRFKEQTKRMGGYMVGSLGFFEIAQLAQSMYQEVAKVDKAMTELKRVTDLSATGYENLYKDLTVSANEYGVALSDMISATADWSRSGFDPAIAKGLAEVTTMYQHIADLDYQTAFENLQTAYKGFEGELTNMFGGDTIAAVGYIGDILNELDNNYAVTAAGVGEAMKRSASSLDVAGNSIQETAGMITGITEVTQDPEKAGNALKVVSMRLRGKTLCLRTRKVCTLCYALNCKNIEDSYIRQSARVA